MKQHTLITGIRQLITLNGEASPRAGAAMRDLGIIENAAILIEDGTIMACGPQSAIVRAPEAARAEHIPFRGVMMPGFCDSHTHPAFLNPRLADFELRVAGAHYSEIKKQGGGIGASIAGVRAASDFELEKAIAERFRRFAECGTTSVEAKSGYGLSLDSELKSLRAIKKAAQECRLNVIPTLLAAHSIPPEFEGRPAEYAELIMKDIIPRAAAEGLASFNDVFCEQNYFTPELAYDILQSGRNRGLRPKVHAEQLSRFGGALLAAKAGAISADHLDYAGPEEIEAMKAANVIATLLPASNYFLGVIKYPNARAMIEAGLPVALATDFNPGTCPCWNMQFVISCACTHMKMTIEEAITASTINGACAMGIASRTGMIAPGYDADLVGLEIGDYREAAYWFGDNLVSLTLSKGRQLYRRAQQSKPQSKLL